MKTVILIPAYNEENTIEAVIQQLSDCGDIVVADDNSTDRTPLIAHECGAKVITNVGARGYESNLNNGFLYAQDNGYRYVVTVDADGQQMADDVKKVVICLLKGYELVLTKRQKYNRFSEYVSSGMTWLFFGYSDLLSGLKGYDLLSMPVERFDTRNLIGMELAYEYLYAGACVYQFSIKTVQRKDVSRFGTCVGVELRIISTALRLIKIRMDLLFSKYRWLK